MPSSRIVIFGQDEALGRSWGEAVAATGARADLITDLAAIDPTRGKVLIAEVPDPPGPLFEMLQRLDAGSSAILIQSAPDLLFAAKQLRNPSIHAVLARDYVRPALLTGVVARLLKGNIFGISKMVPWGVRVYSEVVGGHDDRLGALATLSRFAKSLKLRSKHREAIDLIADELLMNGLYDAPIDAKGKQLFGEVAPALRSGLSLERPAVLQFASDGSRMIVAVRDAFGSLQRDSVLQNLERCVEQGEQIDRKTAGAGLGLYLVANHVSELWFHVRSGIATEVACVIDLKSARQQLTHLGFYEAISQGAEEVDVGKPRLSISTQPSRLGYWPLFLALLLLAIAGVMMAWPYLSAN